MVPKKTNSISTVKEIVPYIMADAQYITFLQPQNAKFVDDNIKHNNIKGT